MGRTLIAVAKRVQRAKRRPAKAAVPPAHVAILALGPSVSDYLEFVKRAGGRHKLCDEVWGINAIGDTFLCDRIFHMDDVRIQQIRAEAQPGSNIAAMLVWLKKHPGPIYTSRPHPDYPGMIAFPLEAVIRSTRFAYFNSTVAYAVALAIHIGVKKLSLYGMDFTYANSHHSEKGRACVEFWLGMAAQRGIALSIPQRSSLMDGCVPNAERLYGYDTLDVALKRRRGKITLALAERAKLPTAEEIEHRYDHTRHPSPLMSD